MSNICNQAKDNNHEDKTLHHFLMNLQKKTLIQQRSPAMRQHREVDIVLCQAHTTKPQPKQNKPKKKVELGYMLNLI